MLGDIRGITDAALDARFAKRKRFYGTPPRTHGDSLSRREPEFDLPPLSAARVATTDAEMCEMTQKFEETFAELTPPEAARPTAHEEVPFEFGEDIAHTRPAAPAEPVHSRDARREPVFVQPRVRREVEPETKASAEMPMSPEAASRERGRWAPAAIILCVALAFAVGAGTGFLVAKRTPASHVDAKIATSAAGGAGLRLDYELKKRPAAAQRRKP